VFKGKRARHLPWAPFLGLLRGVLSVNFPPFGEKRTIHSYNILRSRSQVILYFQRVPQQQLQCVSTLLLKELQQQLYS